MPRQAPILAGGQIPFQGIYFSIGVAEDCFKELQCSVPAGLGRPLRFGHVTIGYPEDFLHAGIETTDYAKLSRLEHTMHQQLGVLGMSGQEIVLAKPVMTRRKRYACMEVKPEGAVKSARQILTDAVGEVFDRALIDRREGYHMSLMGRPNQGWASAPVRAAVPYVGRLYADDTYQVRINDAWL
jgi:hypothetical protein